MKTLKILTTELAATELPDPRVTIHHLSDLSRARDGFVRSIALTDNCLVISSNRENAQVAIPLTELYASAEQHEAFLAPPLVGPVPGLSGLDLRSPKVLSKPPLPGVPALTSAL